MNLDLGSRIGDYEIVAILGAGGMGRVFKVRNVISDRIEAMKILLPDLEHEPELADRLIREIKVQASLQHPNIAALHTALRVENQLLMLMELVEGVTLDERLRQGPIPMRNGVDYIGQVLGALGYAHQHGVIHRDIKPANMMLTPKGVVKLMDFGIAKAAADRKLTTTGTTMGSLYYMSPEQIKGATTLDARSDLYSVGVSLYEIVTGKKPFDGDSHYAIMAAHLEKTPVPPITLDAGLPQMLNDVILMSISREPERRFQSAEAFAAALGTLHQSLGIPAAAAASGPSSTTLTLGPRPPEAPAKSSSRRWVWAGAGALVTVLALIAVIQFGPWRKTSAQSSLQAAPNAAPTSSPAASPAAPSATAPSTDQQPAPVETTPATPAFKADAAPASSGQKRPARPQEQTSAPAVIQSAPPKQSAAPTPALPGADPAVLQELRERLVQLDARAGAVRTSLGNLKRSQAASGMSLRGDMASAETRMNAMIEGANAALNAHDAPAVQKFLDSAERELEKLEKFLGL